MLTFGRCLYAFLTVHSLLSGLFPFYIPVYLYAQGLSLARVCIFIVFTGVGFSLFLYVWERLCRKLSLSLLVMMSLFFEILLLATFFLPAGNVFLGAAGICNGIFNCNFYLLQRLLFLETITPQNSGKKFGNLQIFVLIVLKTAIFIGGVILENSGFLMLFICSGGIATLASMFFLKNFSNNDLQVASFLRKPVSVRSIIGFSDRLKSKMIFILDGIFLYLESYFWLISLFLIVQESFARLGLLVVVLTGAFGAVFIVIKNRIDRLKVDTLYRISVLLYVFSWVLRSFLTESLPLLATLVMLASITFFTSLFRLAFNKRFFDNALATSPYNYIVIKSYYSQIFLCLFLFLPPLLNSTNLSTSAQLSLLYKVAAIVALLYTLYGQQQIRPTD